MACPWLQDLEKKKENGKKLYDAKKNILKNFHGMSMIPWS
jgi:hypothetical protein